MPKAITYSRYGGPEVLEIVDIPMPEPADGEVLIEVIAAGLNPADSRLREGLLAERMPAHFPQGQGSDFAGFVRATGRGVTQCEVNDAVIGHASRASHATHLTVPATNLTPKPPHLPWEVAGGLFVTGTTAWAAVNELGISAGDTVVISAAAGGVGCIAAQLAALRGATVIGTASERNIDFLRQIGVIPVVHDGDIVTSIREAAPNGVDAYLDAFGGDNLETARALRVPPGRVRSVVDWDGVLDYGSDEYGSSEHGVTEPAAESELRADARGVAIVAKLARLAEQHRLLVPVSDIFPLEQVREAFEELDRGHTRGKIVLGMHPVGYAHQHIHEAIWHGVPLKEAAATVDVPTEHAPMRVRENLPPVLGHLPGQRHPHPSDELAEEH
ncbi:NADPH:quinone reductase-like Zn-dependent oxidoreductase [Microterricola gilva]|uniref:NADPH:quinone reductase-like Zn-dependent oxidoreductase n=1 Tax=Microterricola gilva TaxID=393267 RepID=A0A4Q8AN64_9MICO|nr:NADP-dependent oxidoreductase [Microterricola gilva]RZU65958.1 NADPH:quinone reductase-like Zn-dependent oxidoreductase [Microterricola gilva]